MPAFEPAGYQDLRTYLKNNWAFIAILDDTGTERLRWDVNSNANATWSSDETSNPLTAQLTVTGQDLIDAGHSLPVVLDSTEAFKTSSSPTIMATDVLKDANGVATTATMEAPGDEVTISHEYQMPSQ